MKVTAIVWRGTWTSMMEDRDKGTRPWRVEEGEVVGRSMIASRRS